MQIIIYGRYGKYPEGVKCFKRKLNAESINREADKYLITFSQYEFERLDDFFNRMRKQGASNINPYYFHVADENKWFESIIIEREENTFNLIFNVFKEDSMLYGNCLEL